MHQAQFWVGFLALFSDMAFQIRNFCYSWVYNWQKWFCWYLIKLVQYFLFCKCLQGKQVSFLFWFRKTSDVWSHDGDSDGDDHRIWNHQMVMRRSNPMTAICWLWWWGERNQLEKLNSKKILVSTSDLSGFESLT